MRKKFLLLIAVIFSKVTIAQNPYLDYKYALKVNNLTTLSSTHIPVFVATSHGLTIFNGTKLGNRFQLYHPTFAFDWQSKRKNTHELELIDLILNRGTTKEYYYDTNSGLKKIADQTLETAISVRYEYMINFRTQKESRWVPSLGFSLNPYYQNYRSSISDSLSHKIGVQTIGIRAAFNPRITYFFSKRLFISAGFSLTMLDFSRSTYQFPAYPPQQGSPYKTTYFKFKNVKDLIEFRVGIGYKF